MFYTLSALASLTGAQLVGDPDYTITGVENLEAASSKEAAFLENSRYEKQLETTQAGVVFVHPSVNLKEGKNYLVTQHPSLAFQQVIELFIKLTKSGFEGIHPTAFIHPEASVGENCVIAPYAVIDRGAQIGPRSFIGPSVSIGAESVVGADCYFHAHVTIREGCEIGNRVIIQPGAVIGSCGFGYFTDAQGKHLKLNQVGKVVIEDDVEIGANTTIDRARFKETRICSGSKIDNLVQIGHQVKVGKDNLIVAQVGIAGSTQTGQHVIVGGQVGIAGHLTISDGVMLAAKAGVSKSLLQPGPYSGAPAQPIKEFNEQVVHLRNLGKYIKRLKEFEKLVSSLPLPDQQ